MGTDREYDMGTNVSGPIYWSVASVDGEFQRSGFAGEQVFDVLDDEFRDINADLTFGIWGDYDNDGDQDLFTQQEIPIGTTNTFKISIFQNNNGSFSEIQTDMPAGDISLADYDNDNDLDVLLHANLGNGQSRDDEIARLYRNDDDKFVDSGVDPGTSFFCQIESHRRLLIDVDNNGHLDLVSPFEFGGVIGGSIGVRLNKEGEFASDYDLWGGTSSSGTIIAGDYDTDGRIDLFSSGLDDSQCNGGTSNINRNVGGAFEFISAGINQGWTGKPAWADYDADGDLDIISAGSRFGQFSFPGVDGSFSGVYRNDSGNYTLVAELLPNSGGTPVWADFDMDGDLDVLLPSGTASPLFENRKGEFVNVLGAFDGILMDRASWVDYDNDEDLDVLISGTLDGKPVTRLFTNVRAAKNDAPFTPTNLSTSVNGSSVTFNWNAAGDEETPGKGLTYNLRVGTTPGGNDIMSAASLEKGDILQPTWGNTYHNTSWTLNDLPDGTYYWSVQAVDGGFMGSAFAAEQTTDVGDQTGGSGFADSGENLVGLDEGAADWGDYDNDGDLDLLVSGTSSSGAVTRLYRNTGSGLTDTGSEFNNLDLSALKWADIDNDGDLDFILTGRGSGDSHNTFIYENGDFFFSHHATAVPGVLEGAVDWGDYDNDGDLDLLITGLLSSLVNFAGVFQNNNGSFSDINAGLTGIRRGGISWVDYDVDGDLDILTTGRIDNVINRRTLLYRNDEGEFTSVSHNIPNVDLSSVDWGDYDQDGDPDLLLTGTTGSGFISRVYRNDSGVFTDINAGLPGTEFSAARWGDADNDGDLDFLLSGSVGGARETDIYLNNGGSFSALNAGMTEVSKSAVAWADYDNDGDLDVFVMGEAGNNERDATLYENNASESNTPPNPPVEFWSEIGLETVTLNWDQGSDAETTQDGLNYNLRVGTSPGASDILAPMADENGYREVARQGNMQNVQSWDIRLLKAGVYYWSIQSIDANFAGSSFGTEQSFLLLDDLLPVELTRFNAVASGNQVSLQWETASEANNAGFDVERSLDGTSFERIAFVEGQGTAVSMSAYQYADAQLPFNVERIYYCLKQIDFDGQFAYSEVVEVDLGAPSTARLWPNYPNPFNPSTKIRYEIPVAGEVTLTVYDATGKEVRVLVDEFREAGRYETQFDASGLASGVYLYRLTTASESVNKQMNLVK